jgi:hypothetical protein
MVVGPITMTARASVVSTGVVIVVASTVGLSLHSPGVRIKGTPSVRLTPASASTGVPAICRGITGGTTLPGQGRRVPGCPRR